MKTLLHPAYFPNIATFTTMVHNDIVWEVEDNYQKQTYRNRCYICTDQGKHMLNIPIKHVGGDQGRQKYKDVRLDNSYSWQRQHWRTLQTAYRASPFFEYYEDDLAPLFQKPFAFLLDFNLQAIEVICKTLQVSVPQNKTDTYITTPQSIVDARFLINAKSEIRITQEEYSQVFGDRHGFIENLSILDLLFNEGTTTMVYLRTQDPTFLHD